MLLIWATFNVNSIVRLNFRRKDLAITESNKDFNIGMAHVTNIHRKGRQWISMGFVFMVAFVVYLTTMPHTVAFEDDGFFILSSYFNGISHPPGYPLHSLIGYLFSQVPFGTIPARIHAVSAFFGALTVVVIFRLAQFITHKKSLGYLSALAFAFSERFWSQAIIAEVYTLNTFLCFCLIYLSFKIAELASDDQFLLTAAYGRKIALFGLITGLALANHWPLVLLTVPGILLIFERFTTIRCKHIFLFLGCLLVGLIPYLWMFFNSQNNTGFSFAGPVTDFRELIEYVSRKRYQDVDTSQISGIIEKLNYSFFFIKQYALQFTIVGFILSIIGFPVLTRYMNKKQCLGVILIFVGNGFGLIFLLGFEYSDLYRAVISVYFLTAYGIAAITMALGYDYLSTRITIKQLTDVKVRKINAIILILFIFMIFLSNLSYNNRLNYTFADAYARTILHELPYNAVLFSNSDASVGPLGYLQYVKGIRPDIRLMNSKGLVFRDRLFDPKGTIREKQLELVDKFIQLNKDNIYSVEHMPGYELDEYWMYCKVTKRGDMIHCGVPSATVLRFYNDYIFKKEYSDAWTNLFAERLRNRFVPFFMNAIQKNPQQAHKYKRYLDEATNTFGGMICVLNCLESNADFEQIINPKKFNTILDNFFYESTDRRLKAEYCNYRARNALKKKDRKNAEKFINLSLKYNPESTNDAHLYKSELDGVKRN